MKFERERRSVQERKIEESWKFDWGGGKYAKMKMSYFIITTFMETKNMISYSLKEKYLQVQPEGRIRRYQYFARSLAFILPAYIIVFFLII